MIQLLPHPVFESGFYFQPAVTMVVCSGDGCLFLVILPLCCIFVTDTIIINTLITTAIENTKDRGKVEKVQTKAITKNTEF